MNKQLTPLINKYYLIIKKNLMVHGIKPSTTVLLAHRSTNWVIKPSYLLMHNLLQILLSREKRKYWRSKRHMLFASWHFPCLILAPCFAFSLFFISLILLFLSFCLALSMSTWSFFPLPAQKFACPVLIGSIWILFNNRFNIEKLNDDYRRNKNI